MGNMIEADYDYGESPDGISVTVTNGGMKATYEFQGFGCVEIKPILEDIHGKMKHTIPESFGARSGFSMRKDELNG